MKHRYSIPWIHRWSRFLIGAIAVLGVLETAILTVAELTGSAASICPTEGCKLVLTSPYATVFGVPLTLFGFFAYTAVAVLGFFPLILKRTKQEPLSAKAEQTNWLLLFAIATAMAITSSYLMYIMLFVVQAVCPYCITSAVFSFTLLVLTLIGRNWEDFGQVLFLGLIVAMITLVGVLAVYANVNSQLNSGQDSAGTSVGQSPPPIKNISGEAEIALARHLQQIQAKMYGTYTCPHCHDQKELFGKEAFSFIQYIECSPAGKNAQPKLCQAANIVGVPTWEIQGQFYTGVQSLEKLAEISGYKGATNFKSLAP